ncbi:hypothetical protein KJ780_02890 [Candidatus Micrarchaeota archaeon]|nr:hypothetical protein [Candidatus Micrarchaeota archaeon]
MQSLNPSRVPGSLGRTKKSLRNIADACKANMDSLLPILEKIRIIISSSPQFTKLLDSLPNITRSGTILRLRTGPRISKKSRLLLNEGNNCAVIQKIFPLIKEMRAMITYKAPSDLTLQIERILTGLLAKHSAIVIMNEYWDGKISETEARSKLESQGLKLQDIHVKITLEKINAEGARVLFNDVSFIIIPGKDKADVCKAEIDNCLLKMALTIKFYFSHYGFLLDS